MSFRILRINQLLKKEISNILEKKLSGNFGIVTVNRVETSPDLKKAAVFISLLEENYTKSLLEELEKIKREIQREINKKVPLKYTPLLEFKIDKSLDNTLKIEEILKKIKEEGKNG